jgi:hypothetical protein
MLVEECGLKKGHQNNSISNEKEITAKEAV